MITNFMRVMRKYRIRKDMIMKDMTDRIGIRLSELSAIESGVQPLTRSYVERLKTEFDFTAEELSEIEMCLKKKE
ncbi:helix-turn-helix domain-containing protein [Exiguobacterium sp. s130]|uniref:helix-turn-helix domain-containing protein n=1 Tax=Exiguobacterium sp. s130 TaxID=2751190 RepID=UPI001BE50125|nr:helix-turn-helix domain-containing protein [Exiguobacterium sp. s130]